MVGGIVIGLSRKEGKTHVNVADCPHYPSHKRGECPVPDTCCVYTKETTETGVGVEIRIGDSLWWQSGSCYWTPKENRNKPGIKGGVDYDIRLPKLGYSH